MGVIRGSSIPIVPPKQSNHASIAPTIFFDNCVMLVPYGSKFTASNNWDCVL